MTIEPEDSGVVTGLNTISDSLLQFIEEKNNNYNNDWTMKRVTYKWVSCFVYAFRSVTLSELFKMEEQRNAMWLREIHDWLCLCVSLNIVIRPNDGRKINYNQPRQPPQIDEQLNV